MCALWTEICMAFPALDALRDGYEVYPVVDAIGGTSVEAHRAGIERVVQAGANRSAGLRVPASSSATGIVRRRSPTSCRS
jgi:nicotinamidase-related amidase